MNILQTLQQLRDDIKAWVTNNLNALNAKIDEKTIPIDSKLNATSTNPVQNKVITNAINNIPRFSGDYNDLTNAPNIAEDDSGEINITDEQGNIIFKIDESGVHTTAISLNDKDVKSELDKLEYSINNIQGFSGDYNDLTNAPNITEDDSGNMVIADESGNVIFRADSDGIHTTALTLNGAVAATEDYVNEVVANIDIPEGDFTGYATEDYVDQKVADIVNSAPETLNTLNELAAALGNDENFATTVANTLSEKADKSELHEHANENVLNSISDEDIASWNNKSDFSGNYEDLINKPNVLDDESEEFNITDENGNIIFRVDSQGAHTTDISINGTSVLELLNNLPEGGGGGSSVQPDWNQNNSDAADYIKNRPCGDIGKVYLIPEGTMTSEATIDNPALAIYELPSLDGIDFDSPIHININGVEYERNFVKDEIDPGVYWYYFGNMPLILGKGTNGDPFMGMVGVTQNESGDIGYMAMIACIEETTSIPVSVWQDGFKTLDIKYLPKHLQCGETIIGRVKDITWDGNLEGYEYQSLEMDGQTVYVVKMSDATPDIGYLQGGTVTVTTPEGSQIIDLTSDALYDYRNNADSPMPCVMISEVAVVCFDTVNFMGMQLSKGIYFMKSGEMYVSELHLLLEYTISEIKKIDSKFIDLDWSPNPISVTRTNIVPETANVISGNDIEGLTSEIIETLSEVAVILDGVEYISSVYIYRDNFQSDDLIYAGNASLLNPAFPGSATIPFLLLFGTSSVRFIMINPDGTTTDENPHTIQIDGIVKKYETIPDRLLPEKLQKSAGRVVEHECYYTDTSGYTKRAENGAEIFNDYINNKAIGQNSHAEGYNTVAFGVTSHAEGQSTLAYGAGSHAEGTSTKARGSQSHAEGFNTTVSGNYSHAEGYTTIATGSYQHVQGKYNVEDKENKYAHIVGNGDYSTRSNAHTLDWSGNAWFAGEVKIGGTSQDSTYTKTLATTEYVDTIVGDIESVLDAILGV